MDSDEHPCTLTFCDGTHYDLSSLSSASADYEIEVSNTTFKLNVCRGVVSELWKVDDPDSVGGFSPRDEGDFSLGHFNTSLHFSPATNEPMLYMSGGSPCPLNREETASTVIRFICSPSDFEAGTPKLVAALPPLDTGYSCHFFFEWSTHVACPTNPRAELKKHHYIGLGLFIGVIIAWFLAHTLFNRFIRGKRGREQFPIPKFDRPLPSLPSLSRNRTGNGNKPRWGIGRRSQRGYQNVRADEQDEDEGFASRFSLEDEEEGDEDARVLDGNAQVWRNGAGGSDANGNGTSGTGRPTVGAHEGLVDV